MVLLARKCLFALTSSLILMCAVSVPAGSSAVEGGASAAAARADEVRYGTASWDAAAYGNHRAVVRVDRGAAPVRARIPWRRRDAHPEKKNVVIIDAATGARVRNVCPIAVNREYGDLAFQPATVPGDYYLYYLTYVSKGSSHYPTVEYTPMELTAEDSWLKAWGLSPSLSRPPIRPSFLKPGSSRSKPSTTSTASRRWRSSPQQRDRAAPIEISRRAVSSFSRGPPLSGPDEGRPAPPLGPGRPEK